MAVDLTQVAQRRRRAGRAARPRWPPGSSAQEREGEPIDAFQLEEIEVPEPGAFEVIVRVMAAGVNFNNVWAALGKPVSVFRYHPDEDHHIGGSDASGHRLEGRRGRHALEARRRGRHPLQPGLLRGPRGPRPRPARRAVAADLGLRDDLGLVRAVHARSRPSSCCPSRAHLAWEEAASYGLTYFTAYRMLHRPRASCRPATACSSGAPPAASACSPPSSAAPPAPSASASSPRAEKGELVEQLGATGFIDRNEFAGMMRRGGETPEEEKARFARLARLRQARQGDARRRARHRLRARRQGDVPDLGASSSSRSARSSSAARRRATTSTSTSATCGCARSRSSARTSPTPGSATRPTS